MSGRHNRKQNSGAKRATPRHRKLSGASADRIERSFEKTERQKATKIIEQEVKEAGHEKKP